MHSKLLRVSEANKIPINSHICLDDIQTSLKPYKNIGKKFKYIFMIILGLAESFEMMVLSQLRIC